MSDDLIKVPGKQLWRGFPDSSGNHMETDVRQLRVRARAFPDRGAGTSVVTQDPQPPAPHTGRRQGQGAGGGPVTPGTGGCMLCISLPNKGPHPLPLESSHYYLSGLTEEADENYG